MKKYFTLSLLTLLFFPSDIYTQWYSQYFSTGHFVLDIRFINRYTGWACGSSGAILKTTNGGKEWVRQTTNTTAYLTGIFPVNDRIAYACGWYCILKTENGGENWNIVRIGTNQVGELWCLWFIDENTGWFAGDRVMMRTVDGCKNFIDSSYIPISVAEDIHFKDTLNGLITGSDMLKTTNSGLNWNIITIPGNGFVAYIDRFKLIGDTGYAISKWNYTYKTTNYGANWDTISRVPMAASEFISCVDFYSYLTGYCGGSYGKLFKTTNGGYNWFAQNTMQFGPGSFGSIYCFNDSVVWAVGGSGGRYIINTTNGGEILTKVLSPVEKNYLAILEQNYPNPFNSSTKISLRVNSTSQNRIVISKIDGKDIATIIDRKLQPGKFEIVFRNNNLPSGIYFYRLESNNMVMSVKKMIVLK